MNTIMKQGFLPEDFETPTEPGLNHWAYRDARYVNATTIEVRRNEKWHTVTHNLYSPTSCSCTYAQMHRDPIGNGICPSDFYRVQIVLDRRNARQKDRSISAPSAPQETRRKDEVRGTLNGNRAFKLPAAWSIH